MNTRIRPILLLTVLILSACGKQPIMEYDEIMATSEATLTDAKDSPHCEVHIQLLQAKGTHAERINQIIAQKLFDTNSHDLQTAAQAFADQYVEYYRKDMTPLYRDDRHNLERHRWYEYRYNVTTEAKQFRNGVSTYLINTDYYEGGAHGMKQLEILNFDVASGKHLTLDDFFVSGYQAQLSEILLNSLLGKTGSKDKNELRDKGFLYSTDMFATENFIPGDDEFIFVYNPYEIAPYDFGQIELSIDIDDLKIIMK